MRTGEANRTIRTFSSRSGRWTSLANPSNLNAGAAALGASLNVAPPSYIDFEPAQFLRPYDLGTH